MCSDHMAKVLLDLGYNRCKTDPQLFVHPERKTMVALHVDDPMAVGLNLEEEFDRIRPHMLLKETKSTIGHLGKCFTKLKQVGTVVQTPAPALGSTAGRWAMLAIDLAALTDTVVDPGKGKFASLKSVVACCSMNLRATFTSDDVYTAEALPRKFVIPQRGGLAFEDSWVWLPRPP